MNKEEFIQDYIANRLSVEEKARAEKLLQSDAELQELYEMHQEMTAAFKLSNDKALKKRLQTLDDNREEEVIPLSPQKNNFTVIKRIAVAAVFIVGAFFAINQFTGNGDVFDAYFEICPNTYLPVTRGTTSQDAQFEAFTLYESNAFQSAEIAFEKLLKNEENSSIRFYYAMSLMNQEKYELALNELNSLTNTTFEYQAESLWYSALMHLKNKNSATAKEQLQKLQKLNSDYKQKEIMAILEKL
ncbi:hypothetical protein KORDIASMS9_02241 [Kordia sp. SMS9]|uniref:hypothetical protein n=1 Tax=Kordia sp. SMS9 TaxID=2282170 RepID=UPI000E0D51CB|nr:hypothetical protein [Kordia sp. SMS9]AXG70012.1 hypothetical protein KORDIASMS9_02241 [Kordia sp. SMS9]